MIRFTAKAREDLLDLWSFLAVRDPSAADRAVDRIVASCSVLEDHPLFGRARPDIGDGARCLVVERWLALYRVTEDAVQVVRIVDGARDPARFGWSEDEGWRRYGTLPRSALLSGRFSASSARKADTLPAAPSRSSRRGIRDGCLRWLHREGARPAAPHPSSRRRFAGAAVFPKTATSSTWAE